MKCGREPEIKYGEHGPSCVAKDVEQSETCFDGVWIMSEKKVHICIAQWLSQACG